MQHQVENNSNPNNALGNLLQGGYNNAVPFGFVLSPFTPETLHAFDELGLILRGIQQRMTAEGYEIVDGRVEKTES